MRNILRNIWVSIRKNFRKQPVSRIMTFSAVVFFIAAVVVAKLPTSLSLALISFSFLVGAAIFRFAFEGESEQDRSTPEDHLFVAEEQLKNSGSSMPKEVRDKLRRGLIDLKGELQTVRGSKVLWIDDRPDTILGERRLLRALGIDITPARSSERAKEILKEDHDFDLIITDVQRVGTRTYK